MTEEKTKNLHAGRCELRPVIPVSSVENLFS
jgi:hypothetical protein